MLVNDLPSVVSSPEYMFADDTIRTSEALQHVYFMIVQFVSTELKSNMHLEVQVYTPWTKASYYLNGQY